MKNVLYENEQCSDNIWIVNALNDLFEFGSKLSELSKALCRYE